MISVLVAESSAVFDVFVEFFTDEFVNVVNEDLRSVHLLHHGGRYMTRTESRHVDFLAGGVDIFVHLLLIICFDNRDDQLYVYGVKVFSFDIHLFLKCYDLYLF